MDPRRLCRRLVPSLLLVLTSLLQVLTALPASASAGDLDPAFGTDGAAITNFGQGPDADSLNGVAVQPDGKVVSVGSADTGANEDLVVVRYGSDGSLDPTFGDGGVSITELPGYQIAHAVTLQPGDGKILVAGYSTAPGPSGLLVARYRTDGALDPSFGSGGLAVSSAGDAFMAHALTLQPDGKIVAAGGTPSDPINTRVAVVRFNPDGTTDNTFGSGGTVTTRLGTGSSTAEGVAVHAGGIVVAGTAETPENGKDFAVVRYNTNGTLDQGFGAGGVVTTSITPHDDRVADIAILPGGQVLVAGTATTAPEEDGDFAVARYTSAGALDPTFGTAGVALASAGPSWDEARAMAVYPDGEIAVAGASSTEDDDDFSMVRLRPEGSLDPTFGAGGRVMIKMGPSWDRASAVAIQTSSLGAETGPKAVVAGVSATSAGTDQALARLTMNGSLDPAFGSGGIVVRNFAMSDSNDQADALAIQPDGKIVAAGSAWNGTDWDFALARYGAGGDLDPGFGTGGLVTTPLGMASDSATSVLVQPDGKILVAGGSYTDWFEIFEFAVARYRPDGSLDPTFGVAGKVTSRIGSRWTGIRDIALQPDGKIVAVGQVHNGDDHDFAVARYDTSGQLDPTFGTNGMLRTDLGGADQAFAVAIQPGDGKILVAGETGAFAMRKDAAIVRYTPAGALDGTFSGDGVVTSPDPGPDDFSDILIDPSGRVVTAGSAWDPAGGDYEFSVSRYKANGDPDASFGAGGSVITPIGPEQDLVSAVAIQPSGRIVAGGLAYTNGASDDFALVRYSAAGALDEGFGVDGIVVTRVGYGFDNISGIALAADGDIVVSGTTQSAASEDFIVATYLSPLDDVPPAAPSITAFPNKDPGRETQVAWSFTGAEPGGKFRCVLVRPDATEDIDRACVSPKAYVLSGDGSYVFRVRHTDDAGNASSYVEESYTLDTKPPDTSITSNPPNPSSTSATFTFGSSESGSTFECSLDGAAFGACSSPKTYSGLSDGAHLFRVRATDLAGNVDASPAERAWTVDTVAPETTVTSGPQSITSSTSATFAFGASETGSTFACSLDGGPFTTCSSPKSYPGLLDGAHTFRVRATDPAGNTDATPAERSWTVDTAAPETTISSGPQSVTASTTGTFEFGASESGSTFECSLDSAAFAPCTSPKTYSGLADGSHTFRVRATDLAGNVDSSPAGRTWTVDTAAPDTAITVAPSNPSGSREATFQFTATEGGSTFRCSLDGSAFTACTSPKSYSALSDGTHTFQVSSVDPAGNVDPSPAQRGWTVDTVAPETTIASGPTGSSGSSSAVFTFSSEQGANFACSLDGEAFSACASPKSYSGLADGSHTFRVRATDGAGNVDGTPAERIWTVDTTAPETAITSGPSSATTATAASFEFSAGEAGSSFECSLDGGAYGPCTSPKSFSGLGDGSHTFRVRAKDLAGNVDPTPAERTWTVDTTAPETTLTSVPAPSTQSESATLGFSSSEAGSTFVCSLDGGAFAPCTSPKSYSGLGEGAHSFRVRATDAVGHQDPTPASWTWTVDRTAPDTSVTSGPSGTSSSADATFSFSGSESDLSFTCSLDGGGFSSCNSPVSYTGLLDGSHNFRVRARDAAGNFDASPAQRTWTVDAQGPEIAFLRPTTGVYVNDQLITGDVPARVVVGSVTVQARANDPQSGVTDFRFEVDGVPVAPSQVTFDGSVYRFTYRPASLGEHTLSAWATNGSGIQAGSTLTVLGVPA